MAGYFEKEIEADIQARGLNFPRLNPDQITDTIDHEQFYVFPGTTVTVCCLTLRNGYCVIGEAAAVSRDNFDAEIGQRVSRANARDKIWALEGYLLKQKLYQEG